MTAPKMLRLADYRPPEFTTDLVDLNFDIHENHAFATSKVTYRRTAEGHGKTELVLNAQNPNPDSSPDYIRSIVVDGAALAEGAGYVYDKANHEVRIPVDPSAATVAVEIKTYLEPEHNTALSGLYQSDKVIITQCEAEGFRCITPFTDRPDVMSLYKVRIEAPEDMCPVLLSNGNQTAAGKLGNGRHWASFEDPHRKPCYLFCTANGPLVAAQDFFTTMSGNKVELRTFIETGEDPELARHAVNALKGAMKFDENVFGCEYDLDKFDTVAVAKFTAGAMENKGLNVFRDSLIKTSPRTATDGNYQSVIDVVGHEYFHNWSGDRVTLANWFNISLKEGLTVRREQMFTAHTTSAAVERISAVQGLRGAQFTEDDGPLAHPVLPKEVMSIDNCYSATIYDKGAEVIRMMGELMGEDKLIQGIKNYFKKYDGQAVTINEFIGCMNDISGLDFNGQFRLWYDQSGRPQVKAAGAYDAASQTYTLTLEQSVPPTKDQPVKQPMLIPVRMGLVDAQGHDMPLVLDTDDATTQDSGATERVLQLTGARQTFVFKNVAQEPAFHSLLRGFSAIVDLDPGLSEDQLYKQLLTDPDGFNRWDAGQKIALAETKRLYEAQETTGAMPAISQRFLDARSQMANDKTTDPALLACALSMPGIKTFEASVKPANPASIAAVRKHLRESIGRDLYQDFADLFKRLHDGAPYSFDYASVGKRSLKGMAVAYMLANGGAADLAAAQDLYFKADNMTDKVIAMGSICDHLSPEREAVFDDFYQTFQNDSLVIQKWFGMQAYSNADGIIDHLKTIAAGPVFDWSNPGHVGSLIGGFAGNYEQFHRPDGKGYAFLADGVIKENGINPSTASRLVAPLCRWQSYTAPQAKLMIDQLDRINAVPTLHQDVRERILLSLPDDAQRKSMGLIPAAAPTRNNPPQNPAAPPAASP